MESLKNFGSNKKMKESLFNYRFEYENQKYIFNTNNNGLIQINNDIFTEEEREYLRVNRFWVDDNEDEIALLEREINHNIQKRQKELELTQNRQGRFARRKGPAALNYL